MMNRTIGYLIIALIMGLVMGYFIFGGEESHTPTSEEHNHSIAMEDGQWTCSMHPQIMLPESGSCPICAMDLVPVAMDTNTALSGIQLTENAMALANIQTTIIGTAMKTETNRSLSGKIAVNEENKAVQVSYFDGRMERLYVNYEGQNIRKGQLMAQIYAPELIAAQQELITSSGIKASQPALYMAVRNKLKLWKLSEEQINAIERSGKIQENVRIYATVAGTVDKIMVAEGDYVAKGQALMGLNNLGSVWAQFDVYENQLPQLEKGTAIAVTAKAYPNEIFKAKISFIDPILNTQTRTVTVRATLDNADGRFKPGMFVSAALKERSPATSAAIVVPTSAVLWTGKRSLVYVKQETQAPSFEMREVILGTLTGESYTIVSGLENGEEVVTNGAFTVDAAAQLQGKKSMMNHKKDSLPLKGHSMHH